MGASTRDDGPTNERDFLSTDHRHDRWPRPGRRSRAARRPWRELTWWPWRVGILLGCLSAIGCATAIVLIASLFVGAGVNWFILGLAMVFSMAIPGAVVVLGINLLRAERLGGFGLIALGSVGAAWSNSGVLRQPFTIVAVVVLITWGAVALIRRARRPQDQVSTRRIPMP